MKSNLLQAKKFLALLLVAVMIIGILPVITINVAAASEAVVSWTGTLTSGTSVNANGGANQQGASFTTSHGGAMTASAPGVYVSGWNGSPNKYWLLTFSTENFNDLAISATQRSSGTGPRDFKLHYSLDKLNWEPVTSSAIDATLTTTGDKNTLVNVSLPSEMNNQSIVYLKLEVVGTTSQGGGTIGSAGTSRLGQVTITGTAGLPEPTPPSVDITSIEDALKLPVNTTVTIQGIGVYNIRNGAGSSDNGVYVQDETAGIDIFMSGNGTNIKNAAFGKEVQITGNVANYNGLMEIMITDPDNDIVLVDDNPTMPEPIAVTVEDVNNSVYPFMLVSLENVTLLSKNGTYTSGHNNYTVEQNGHTVTLYGPATLQDGIVPGDKISILKGVSSVNANVPQIYVNSDSAADIVRYEDSSSQVAAVTAIPGSSAVTPGTSIALSTATQGAVIKYTLNGIDYIDYEEPFAVSALPVTVKAYATKDGLLDSEISTFTYTEKIVTPPPADGEYTHYYGQLHAHTNNSDGTGTYDQAFNYAKNTAGLDFFAITDHSNYYDSASNLGNLATGGGSNGSAWLSGLAAADSYTDPAFVGITGFEMTWSNTAYGHMNTFNTPGYVSRNNSRYTNMTGGQGLQNYYDDLTDYPMSISQFNHPGTTFGSFSDFAYYTAARDRVINLLEIGNGDGSNKQLNNGYWRSDSYYDRALAKGWHVAPTNNQDNHKADWGGSNDHRTIVLATELTRDAIYDAIAERRVYSSENSTMKLDYTLNGAVIGSIIGEQTGDLEIEISAENTKGNIGMISLVSKNGLIVTSQEFYSNTAEWNFTIPNNNGYYYVLINQPNGDMTLTAPIWVGEVAIEQQGITSLKLDAGTPMHNQPINLTTKLFNDASTGNFVINSISYTDANGIEIADTKTDVINVAPNSTYDDVVSISPIFGNNIVNVTVTGTYNGATKISTAQITFNAIDPSTVTKVVIDAAHMNAYVGDNYALNLQTLEAAVADAGIVFEWATEITDEVLAGASGLIITTPYNRSTVGAGFQRYTYTPDELDAIKNYADNGGNLLLMARADYGEASGDLRTWVQMNGVLDKFGLTTRINGDELCLNSTATYQFSIPSSTYTKNGIFADLSLDKEYRVYSASGLVAGANTIPLITGIPGMISYDSANRGDVLSNATGTDMLVLAQENTVGGGIAYIAGSTFCSSFESDTTQYDNFTIAKAMLMSFAGEREINVTPIADARKASEGTPFTIEGIVTSQSSGHGTGNAFFDCIYVQDITGGICIHPVSDLQLQVGQKVRVTGIVKTYLGDIELGVTDQNQDVEIIDDSINPVAPKVFENIAESMVKENEGWLAQITGTVTSMSENGDIYLKDDNGNEARVFIDGYIKDSKTGSGTIDPKIVVGSKITVVGLTSVDTVGQRLRVRDLAEVTLNIVVPKTYTVSFNTQGGSWINPVTVNEGDIVARPADPVRAGYTLKNWRLDRPDAMTVEEMEIYNFDTPVTSNITLFAEWEDSDVNVTELLIEGLYAPVAGETAATANQLVYNKNAVSLLGIDWNPNLSNGKFEYSTAYSIEMQFKINAGYRFPFHMDENGEPVLDFDVIVDGVSPQNVKINSYVLANSDTEITYVSVRATFEKTEDEVFTVTFDDGNKINKVEVDANETVARPADPVREGYTFEGWFLNGREYNFKTPVTSDIKLVAEWGKIPEEVTVVSATPTASVEKLKGNENQLTIKITEKLSDGSKNVITKTFTIKNNAAGNYTVGTYKVYVDTKGNTQVRECYIVK